MEQLTPLLEKLAQQLGTTVEHLWGVLLQQANIEIILCTLWMNIFLWGGIIIIALAIIMFIYGAKSDEEGIVAFAIGLIVFTIIIAGIGYYANYSEMLTLQNNPQYWALKEVLKQLN